MKFKSGDQVLGVGGSDVAGIEGTVLGYKDDKLRVNFDGVGKRRVTESDVIPAPGPAPKPTELDIGLPSNLDGAALDLLYKDQNMGTTEYKGHDVDGTWIVPNPTELYSENMQNTSNKARWFRDASKDGGQYLKHAKKFSDKEFASIVEKVNKARASHSRVPINPGISIQNLVDGLQDSSSIEKLSPLYTYHERAWKKCLVFKKEPESGDKYPIWLLVKGELGWEPDIRTGVLYVDREQLHSRDSKVMEEDMKQAEIGEITRVALTMGDMFSSPVALEQALTYFPQCFAPPNSDQILKRYDAVTNKSSGTASFPTRRFAVKQQIPQQPLEQFGHHPSWKEGSYVIRNDQNVVFKPDTPTGGPLLGSPCWPTNAVCVECGLRIDASQPGGVLGGTILPSFIGRTDPTDYSNKRKEFIHVRTCVFARKEREQLCSIEFLFRHPKQKDASKLQKITLPIDYRRGISPEKHATGEWWVGEKGIIHVDMKGKSMTFLHFPSRKLVFQLTENGKPVSEKGAPFEEGSRPVGYVTRARYAPPGSAEYLLMIYEQREERQLEAKKLAIQQADDKAKEKEAEEAAASAVEIKPDNLLTDLNPETISLLDEYSYVLEDRRWNDDTVARKAISLSSESDDESQHDDEHENSSSSSTDEEQEESDTDEEELETDKAMKRDAEDDGDISMDSDLPDIEDRQYIPRSTRIFEPIGRSPKDLLPYIYALKRLSSLAANTDGTLKKMLDEPMNYISQLNAYFGTFQDDEKVAETIKSGCEVSFPPIKQINRDDEWVSLQREWGAGLPSTHFTKRFMTEPYKRVKGPDRGVYKAIARLSQEDHYRFVLIECLLLSRSIERRQKGLLASKVAHYTDKEFTELGADLQKLYLDESVWLQTAKRFGGDAKDLRDQASAQLLIPEHRISTSTSGVVRIHGIQETQRMLGSEAHLSTCSEITSEQASQLLQVYHFGKTIKELGVHRGCRGRWIGTVGPAVTELNFVLRGIYVPFKGKAAATIDNMMAERGQWVYETKNPNTEDVKQTPVESLLGEKVDLSVSQEGTAFVPISKIESFLGITDYSSDEDAKPDWKHPNSSAKTSSVKVQYTFTEYSQYCKMRLEILSGVHEGVTTTLAVYMKSAVQRLLWESGIRDEHLSEVIQAVCKPSPERPARVSSLYWLLLESDYDRRDESYPWRFHSLFRRFGLTKDQCIKLKEMVVTHINSKLSVQDSIEIQRRWRNNVRFKCYEAWNYLMVMYPPAYKEDDMDEDDLEVVDDFDDGEKKLFQDDDSSDDQKQKQQYEEPAESPAHGVDIHVNSEFNRLVQEIMEQDPIGRVAILRALHSIRGQNGEQRYTIEDGMLIDNNQEIYMTQGTAGKLARRIRKEVRKYDCNKDHDYDSSDSESSNWDEISEISSEDSFTGHGTDRKISDDPSDPFSRPTMEKLSKLPGSFSGNCRRCNVTIQNLYRFSETVADLISSVSEFSFELCPPADSSLECEMNKKDSMDTDDIESSPLYLLDRVICNAITWSKLKNTINPATGGKHPPAAIHEAKQNYLNAVVQLWECIPEEDEYENETEGVSYINSEADEDEPQTLLAKWRAEETNRCKSGLCKAWDSMCCVHEEMTCLDTAIMSNTTFKFSLVKALSQGVPIPAATIAQIDTLPYHDVLKFYRNFDSRMLLPMFAHSPMAAAFSSFLKRTSAFVPQDVVLNRLIECNQDPALTEKLVSISCSPLKYGGSKSVPLKHVLRPFEFIYHGVTAGSVVSKFPCSCFEHALAVAYREKASHFSFDPVAKQVEIRTFNGKDITFEPLSGSDKNKKVFCTVSEERLDEQGRWITFDTYSKKYLEEDHPDIAWEVSPEARRDPTDNQFYTLDQFKDNHPDHWDEAWKEAEPRRYDPDSKQIYTYTLRKSSTGQDWDDMIELRRAPTIGFPDFETWKEYAKKDEKGTLDGKWLTRAEFIRRVGLKSGTRRWGDAESKRFVKQHNKLMTYEGFVEKTRKSLATVWNRLPRLTMTNDVTEETSILYEINLSDQLLRALGKEEHDTEEQFCTFANLNYSWIIDYQAFMGSYAIFVPKLGDFSTSSQFTVTLRKGVMKSDFEESSRKFFSKCEELRELVGKAITNKDYKKGLLWNKCFTISKCEVTATCMNKMLQSLNHLRTIADKSKSLQKAFKIRESAFPKMVFQVLRLLQIKVYEKKGISGTELVDCNAKLEKYGCRRLMTTAIRGLGYETWEESVAAAEEGSLPLPNLLDQLSAQVSTNWAKPIPPVSLSYAESLASGMGYIISDADYSHISQVLNLEGASGILDWAIKSSMHSHVPLPMTMRKVSRMVNVIIFLPVEIRHPTVELYEEVDTGKPDWDIELFNDTLPFEQEDSKLSETRDEFNASMYSGYKVRNDRIRRMYTTEDSETKIIAGFKEREGICKIRPIVLVTEMPINFHSYRIRSNKLMQPVAWDVRASLVPHAVAKQQLAAKEEFIDVGKIGSTYEFTYVHRHTERWSPAIVEDDFAPGHIKWAPGRWLPGDRIELFEEDNKIWSPGMIIAVSTEHIPKVELKNRVVIPTCPAHVRHAAPTETLWYNQVPYTPMQWSPRFEIADQVSTLFTCETSPTVEEPHPSITNWCEVIEYVPHPSELLKLTDDEAPFRRLKLANNDTFLATRTTDELHWEWGDYYRQGDCFNFTCTKQGLPGRSKGPSVKSFAAVMEDRTGASMIVSGRKYVRKNPKRLFIIADEDHPDTDDNNWSYLGAYDLYDKEYNNQPVWVSTDEMSWVFADKTGKWAISMLLGGPPLLKSKQNADTLPAVCTYVMADDQKGWVDCDSIFFVTTLTKYESIHIHNQLARLGVGRRTMNELGFDADDDEEATRELHNQLEQRRVGESSLCEQWDAVRCLHSQLLHSISHWKQLDRANTKDAAITQVVRVACEELVDRTGDMISEDNKLAEYELERDEDDCIHNAAIALEKYGYSEETCAQWAREIRIVEGSLYNPSRQKILSNYYDSVGLADKSQAANATFRSRAELCLRNEEATLWSSDRWINKLFSMSHSVILRDFDCAARHEARKSDHQFLLSAHHASKNRQDLSSICRIIRERIMQLSGPLQNHLWWPLISEAFHYPRAAFVDRVCKHFNSSGHVDVVLNSLKSVESKSFPHTRHEDLWDQIRACCRFLTSMLPKKWDVDNIDWDEGESGTRLPAPVCIDPRVNSARDRLAIRWPANFTSNKFCGVQGSGSVPLLVSRWMQEFLDGFQRSMDFIGEQKTVLGKLRQRDYFRHRQLALKATGDANDGISKSAYDRSSVQKRLRRAYNKSQVAKKAKAKWRSSEAAKIAMQEYRKSDRAKESRREYNKTMRAREARRRWNESEMGQQAKKSYKATEKYKEMKQAYRKSEAAKEQKKAYRQSEAAKEQKKAYRQSEAAKEHKKAYKQTEAAKEKKKAYRQTEAAKEQKKAYKKTEAAKEAKKAWRQSEAGKEAKRREHQKRKAARAEKQTKIQKTEE